MHWFWQRRNSWQHDQTQTLTTVRTANTDRQIKSWLIQFIGSAIAASFWIMQPFLPAIIWAMTLVIATWPLMLRVQQHVGNRRGIAVLIAPFWLAISMIVANSDQIADLVRTVQSLRVPPPPDWLADVPLVGATATKVWLPLTSAGVRDLAPKLTPYAGALTHWSASAAGSLGALFVQFLLTVAIAAIMYAKGEQAAAIALRFGRRLGGERGEMAVHLAGEAIRGVALGVVVTALAQSVIGGIALAVVGVPFAPVLTALMFVLCLAQVGPGLVLIPAVVWMYYAGATLWATVLLVLAIVAMTMDNFLRPALIRRGADLPLLLNPSRCHWRSARIWPAGYLSRPDNSGSRLHAPDRLACRGRH
jgi:predicted PurR-regulated permease PerM